MNQKIENDDDLYAASDLIGEKKLTLKKMKVERDQEIQTIQETHNPNIDAFDDEVKALEAPVKRYIKRHQKRITGDGKRTYRSSNAIVKLRKSPPSIRAEKGHTLDSVAKAIQDAAANLKQAGEAEEAAHLESLLHHKVELDRHAALKLTDEQLESLNLKRSQSQSITIEPQTEQLAKAS